MGVSINYVVIGGNLTKDIELRYTPNGHAVADFVVAINRKYRNQAGELKEEVDFIGVTTFGKTAESCSQYLKKGSPVLVTGRLKQDRWEDDQGKPQTKTKVFADSVQWLTQKKKEDELDDSEGGDQ